MKSRVAVAIFTTGFSGIVGQMILLRELLIVFSGNELSIGVVLANWLALEAFGCFFLGQRAEHSRNVTAIYAGITILFSLSLPVMVYVTRILRTILGLSIGEKIGILPILYSSFLMLMPVSMFHGALFTFGCKVYSAFSKPGAASIGKAYVYETFGTIAGGITWTYLLIPYFHTFHMAAGLAAVNFLVCIVLLLPALKTGRWAQRTAAIVSCLLLVLGMYSAFSGEVDKLHQRSIETQWAPQNPVHYQNSRYGNICVIERDGQYTFFLDGIPHIETPIPDIVFVEEFVHLPLLSHPDPKELLVLSGGAGGVINEALKHPSVESIEYAELDPLVLELVRKFPAFLTEYELTDERVKVRHMDGRLFLKKTRNGYDVILVGLRELSDLQTNRFFTQEFFSLAEKRLNRGGILVTVLPGSLTYLNDELRDLNSSVFHTIKNVFPHVRVIPGEGTNLFLASNSGDISLIDEPRLASRVSERKLRANVVVPRHIEHKLHPGWQQWFLDFVEEGSRKTNHDFRPVGVFYGVSHWNALVTPALRGLFRWCERMSLWMFVVLFFFFAATALLLRAGNIRFFGSGIPFSIGTTGFAGMMFDLALIFVFQAMYGYVFAWIGLLVTSFMAGSACGAMVMISVLPRIRNDIKSFIILDLTIVCFALLLPVVFLSLQPHLDSPALFLSLRAAILLLSFVSGLLVGAQFPVANRIYLKKQDNLSRTAGLFYGSDLLGGWIGGIAGGIVLLPVLGLVGTCVAAALVKACSLIVVAVHTHIRPEEA